jgi:hypothetical protein
MNAVGALASNSSLAWGFVDALWAAPIPEGDAHDTDRYYSGSLYLEALRIGSTLVEFSTIDGHWDV